MARSGGAPKARLRLDSGSAGDVSSMEARPKRLFGRRAERSLERSLQLPASPDTIRCQFSLLASSHARSGSGPTERSAKWQFSKV